MEKYNKYLKMFRFTSVISEYLPNGVISGQTMLYATTRVKTHNIQAYCAPNWNSHNTDYIKGKNKRLQYSFGLLKLHVY